MQVDFYDPSSTRELVPVTRHSDVKKEQSLQKTKNPIKRPDFKTIYFILVCWPFSY
jgi:hypothetical protein